MPTSIETRALVLPLATALLFAGAFIGGSFATAELPPFTIAFVRIAVATTFLFALARVQRVSLRVAPRHLGWLALAGVAGVVLYQFFFLSALTRTEIAHTAIINATIPIFTGFAAALCYRERFAPLNYLGVVVAFMGVLVLLTKGHLETLRDLGFNSGDLLMLCSVLSWVVYQLITRRLMREVSGFACTFYATLSGMILLLPLALTENPLPALASAHLPAFAGIVYMGVGASSVGFLLYNRSLARIGLTRSASIVYSCVPAFVALLSFVILGDPITAPMLLSMGMIIAGLNLMLRPVPTPAPSNHPAPA